MDFGSSFYTLVGFTYFWGRCSHLGIIHEQVSKAYLNAGRFGGFGITIAIAVAATTWITVTRGFLVTPTPQTRTLQLSNHYNASCQNSLFYRSLVPLAKHLPLQALSTKPCFFGASQLAIQAPIEISHPYFRYL